MKIVNKKFNHDYEKIESFEAGIVLTGGEVKSIREGRLRLEDSYVKFFDDGPYLINAQIAPYFFANQKDYDPKRSRKILLNKKEIIRLKTKIKSSPGLTVIPISCYNKRSFLKLEIALAKGRKEIEKRKLEKRREIEREKEREVKEWMRS
jgi:SsrA-binding protein